MSDQEVSGRDGSGWPDEGGLKVSALEKCGVLLRGQKEIGGGGGGGDSGAAEERDQDGGPTDNDWKP